MGRTTLGKLVTLKKHCFIGVLLGKFNISIPPLQWCRYHLPLHCSQMSRRVICNRSLMQVPAVCTHFTIATAWLFWETSLMPIFIYSCTTNVVCPTQTAIGRASNLRPLHETYYHPHCKPHPQAQCSRFASLEAFAAIFTLFSLIYAAMWLGTELLNCSRTTISQIASYVGTVNASHKWLKLHDELYGCATNQGLHL